MRASFPWTLLLVLGCCLVACGGDDDDGGEDNTAGKGNTTDRCHDGCIATLAAKCSISPKDQATCESDCHTFETGNCSTEYKAFQDCSVGEPVTCHASFGFPVVAACETEQGAFIACAEK